MISYLIKTTVETITDNFLPDEPTHIIAPITEEKYKFILRMRKIIKKEKLYCIEIRDASPDFTIKDEDYDTEKEYTAGTEGIKLCIRENDIYWRGYLKHTSVAFESEEITYKHLKDLKEYSERPIEDMSLYVLDKDFELQYIAKEKLKSNQ